MMVFWSMSFVWKVKNIQPIKIKICVWRRQISRYLSLQGEAEYSTVQYSTVQCWCYLSLQGEAEAAEVYGGHLLQGRPGGGGQVW